MNDTPLTAFSSASAAPAAPGTFDDAAASAPAPLQQTPLLTGTAARNLRRENGLSVSDGEIRYQIHALSKQNVDPALIVQMLALQDRVAVHKTSHEDNFIDFKSEQEVRAHFDKGGQGFGIFTEHGTLIGQLLLSFAPCASLPFAKKNDTCVQGQIDWLMVAPDYAGNNLFGNLMTLAQNAAKKADAQVLRANVRTHNIAALKRFCSTQFLAAGMGINGKDGSHHMQLWQPLSLSPRLTEDTSVPVVRLANLHGNDECRASFMQNAQAGLVGVWDLTAEAFCFHRLEQHTPPTLTLVPNMS